MTKPLLILIAGPYQSGTNGDPDLIAENLRKLEEAAWPIFELGHIPMIGEWVALPVLTSAGPRTTPDQVLYPTADRLLHHCNAVLRLPGDSRGADQDVKLAHDRGLAVYYELSEIPPAA